MDVVAGPQQHMRSFLDPALCFLCEQSLTALQNATRIVDTAQDYWEKNSFNIRLHGRKYLCEGCVHHVATALGYVTQEKAQQLIDAADGLRAHVEELEKASDLSEFIKQTVTTAMTAATPTAAKE
jgi:hypothetical protein